MPVDIERRMGVTFQSIYRNRPICQLSVGRYVARGCTNYARSGNCQSVNKSVHLNLGIKAELGIIFLLSNNVAQLVQSRLCRYSKSILLLHNQSCSQQVSQSVSSSVSKPVCQSINESLSSSISHSLSMSASRLYLVSK